MHRVWSTVIFLLISGAPVAHAAEWSSTNLQILHGVGYELGPRERTLLTFEHASGWAGGDHFFFFDVTEPTGRETDLYGEWQPRLSFSKLTGREPWAGVVKDVLLAGQLNFGKGFRAYLVGIGFDLDLPGFSFFQVNVYARDENLRSGQTWQITPAWLFPFTLGETHWQFTGFVDWAGSEGDGKSNVQAQPQLLLDLGTWFGSLDQLQIGIEYQYWRNKFGVDGVTENAPEAMLKWTF